MSTATAQQPPLRQAARPANRWVALIDTGSCACPGCPGALGQPDRYRSWRRCLTCGCSWTVSEIAGVRREGVFVNPRCPARQAEAAERVVDAAVDGQDRRSGDEGPRESSSRPLAPARFPRDAPPRGVRKKYANTREEEL